MYILCVMMSPWGACTSLLIVKYTLHTLSNAPWMHIKQSDNLYYITADFIHVALFILILLHSNALMSISEWVNFGMTLCHLLLNLPEWLLYIPRKYSILNFLLSSMTPQYIITIIIILTNSMEYYPIYRYLNQSADSLMCSVCVVRSQHANIWSSAPNHTHLLYWSSIIDYFYCAHELALISHWPIRWGM